MWVVADIVMYTVHCRHWSNLVELHITRYCTFVLPLQTLPPVQSVAISATGASSLTALVALQRQNLMPHLLQGEVGRFAQCLEEACQIPEAAGWLTEELSGGSNVLHVLAGVCVRACVCVCLCVCEHHMHAYKDLLDIYFSNTHCVGPSQSVYEFILILVGMNPYLCLLVPYFWRCSRE